MPPTKLDQSSAGLQNLIAERSVECGFYIGCGTREVVPLVLDMLVKRTHPTTWGAPGPVGRIIWIDSGNAFDAYRVAVAARERGLNPGMVLRSIRIARPFTAFQFHEMLSKVPMGGTPPLVIISDLMSLFYDSEIQEDDMERAFKRFLERLTELKRHAVVVALLVQHMVPPQRRHLLPPVLNMAQRVFIPPVFAPTLSRLFRQPVKKTTSGGMKGTLRNEKESSPPNVLIGGPVVQKKYGFPIETFGNDDLLQHPKQFTWSQRRVSARFAARSGPIRKAGVMHVKLGGSGWSGRRFFNALSMAWRRSFGLFFGYNHWFYGRGSL